MLQNKRQATGIAVTPLAHAMQENQQGKRIGSRFIAFRQVFIKTLYVVGYKCIKTGGMHLPPNRGHKEQDNKKQPADTGPFNRVHRGTHDKIREAAMKTASIDDVVQQAPSGVAVGSRDNKCLSDKLLKEANQEVFY
jgi:hypothetical protein